MAITVSSNLKKANSSIPFSVDDQELKGGFRCVNSLAERDAIPVGARRSGMVVRVVTETDTVDYTLPYTDLSNSGWIVQEQGSGGAGGGAGLPPAPNYISITDEKPSAGLPSILTMLGDHSDLFPYIDTMPWTLTPEQFGHIKKFYAGFYKADMDIENPEISKMMAGMIVNGDANSTDIKFVLNGVIIFHHITSESVGSMHVGIENGVDGPLRHLQLGYQPIDYIQTYWSTRNGLDDGQFEMNSEGWYDDKGIFDPVTGAQISFGFDCVNIKYGWHADLDAGATAVLGVANDVYLNWSGPMAYTDPTPNEKPVLSGYLQDLDNPAVTLETMYSSAPSDISTFINLGGSLGAWQNSAAQYFIDTGHSWFSAAQDGWTDTGEFSAQTDYYSLWQGQNSKLVGEFRAPYYAKRAFNVSYYDDPSVVSLWTGVKEFPGVASSDAYDAVYEMQYIGYPITFEQWYGHRTLPLPTMPV